MASGREHLNRLNGAINTSVGTLTFEFPAGQIAAGALLAIDLELFYVWSVAGQIATVQRAMHGSTSASHADDALIYVNPVFTDFAIFSAINDEIESLSSPANGLYSVGQIEIPVTVASTYDIGEEALKILGVQYNAVGPSGDWPYLRRWTYLPLQAIGSGNTIQLYEMPSPGRTLRVTYAAELSTLDGTLTENVTVTGLPDSAYDIPPLGAAARLLSAREARRSSLDSQPESRQAADVPPGTARSGASALLQLRKQRIVEEAARLSAIYPTVMRPAV